MSEQWVLVGVYGSGPCEGQPQYHMCDTVIGPASTPDLAKAQVFASREEAMESGGFTHWASFLEPQPLSALSLAEGKPGLGVGNE